MPPTLLRRLLRRVPLGVDSHALWQLLQAARAGDEPPRTLVLEPRLLRAVQRAGCTLVTAAPADAVCTVYINKRPRAGASAPRELSDLLGQLAGCVRTRGVVLLCTRANLPRTTVCAAFLHAGLTALSQVQSGRYVLTAGQTLPPLAQSS